MNGITATVIADSISEAGARLTTMVWRYPRFIHSEIMTHRQFSRNAASSRAIPVEKMLAQVLEDPAVPIYWGKNQSGMQAREELTGDALESVREDWREARHHALAYAKGLQELGLHKQIANRLLEPWMWMTCLVTATEWDNFFHLRCHPDAQPEFQALAFAALKAMNESTPVLRYANTSPPHHRHHLPFITDDERDLAQARGERVGNLIGCSVARCARVSYLNHDKTNPDPVKDLELAKKLQESGHMSPFEHVAWPIPGGDGTDFQDGNFWGWYQYRKTLQGENKVAFPGLKKHGVAT